MNLMNLSGPPAYSYSRKVTFDNQILEELKSPCLKVQNLRGFGFAKILSLDDFLLQNYPSHKIRFKIYTLIPIFLTEMHQYTPKSSVAWFHQRGIHINGGRTQAIL